MYSPFWQIGLDIQNNSIHAVGLQKRRYGWQLRHWWHHALPAGTFHGESLYHTEELISLLRHWRRLLPRWFSLRVALPTPLIMQQTFPLPNTPLREEELRWYVESKIKQLPLGINSVSWDYSKSATEPEIAYVTAARREDLQQWLVCLAKAGLIPQIVDIMPCALRRVARAANISPALLLVHHTESSLLWVSPLQQPLTFGVIPVTTQDISQSILQACEAYQQATGLMQQRVCYSSADSNATPLEAEQLLQPFTAIRQLSPPIPHHSSGYALAVGLALRESRIK